LKSILNSVLESVLESVLKAILRQKVSLKQILPKILISRHQILNILNILILKYILTLLLRLKISKSELLEPGGARRRCGIVGVVVLTIHSGVSRSVIKNYAVDLTCRNEWREK